MVLDELLCSLRFTKALYRQALALEGLQQSQNALEAMLAAQKQLPHDVQASIMASVCLIQHVNCPTYSQYQSLSCCSIEVVQRRFSLQCALQLQIRDAVVRLRKAIEANKQPPSATSNQEGAHPTETEAPGVVHLKKRIKLEKGWLYQPSADGVDENLLILLHGYGDTPGDLSAHHQCCLAEVTCS